MDFSFTDEQVMLRDSVKRFLADAYDFDGYRKIVASDAGYSADIWAQFAELQYQALPIREADGGLGYGPVELMLVMEELGRSLCIEPYLANVVLAGKLIESLGSEAQRAALLPGLLDGSAQISFAFAETGGRYQLSHCETQATADGDGYRLNGDKIAVLNAPNASKLLILARTAGQPADESGLSVFVVDPAAAGVTLSGHALYGGGVAANLTLSDVQVGADALLGPADQAFAVVESVMDLATVAICAESYGAMQALLEKTVEYLKTRKQFGKPLASFQVLQHRLVDMYIEVQQTQSMILMAMLKFSDNDRAEQRRAASACKAYVAKAGRFIAQQAVQLHGGIGMTEELDIGHYFRRLGQLEVLCGDRRHHLRRFAALARNANAADTGNTAEVASAA